MNYGSNQEEGYSMTKSKREDLVVGDVPIIEKCNSVKLMILINTQQGIICIFLRM